MKKRNIKKYIIFPIIILSIFAVVDLPKSHAKYVKTGAFAYSVELAKVEDANYNPQNKIKIDYESENPSTYTVAKYIVNFDRNKIMYDVPGKSDILDTYKIKLKNTSSCQIINNSIKSNGQNDIKDGVGIVKYENSINEDDNITFEVECNVVDDTAKENTDEYISLDFEIEEIITNWKDQEKASTYITLDSPYQTQLAEYYSKVSKQDEDETETLYQKAIKSLKTKYPEDTYQDFYTSLMRYFNYNLFGTLNYEELEKTNVEFSTAVENTTLEGYSYDSTNKTSNFDDNFLGYAYTWEHIRQNPSTTNFEFAFSSNENNIDTLKYYLEQYANQTFSSNDINTIINYINSYANKMEDVFNNHVAGISTTTNNSYIKIIKINSSILQTIENLNKSIDEAQIASNETSDPNIRWDTFSINVEDYYYPIFNDWVLLSDIFGSSKTETIKESFLKNTTKDPNTEEIVTFSDFYIINGSSNSRALLNIYSTNKDKNNTYYKLSEIKSGSEITLAFPIDGTYNKTMSEIVSEINQTSVEFTTPNGQSADGLHTWYEIDGTTYYLNTNLDDNIKYLTFEIK